MSSLSLDKQIDQQSDEAATVSWIGELFRAPEVWFYARIVAINDLLDGGRGVATLRIRGLSRVKQYQLRHMSDAQVTLALENALLRQEYTTLDDLDVVFIRVENIALFTFNRWRRYTVRIIFSPKNPMS